MVFADRNSRPIIVKVDALPYGGTFSLCFILQGCCERLDSLE